MTPSPCTRFLRPDDLDALIRLERRQWSEQQAADEEALRQRIDNHAGLCVGAFCPATGEALASLFMKPVDLTDIRNASSWADCSAPSRGSAPAAPSRLFGISLTSVDPRAAASVFEFFWPYALKQGYREIYLGSPIPGLRRALADDPTLGVEDYVYSRREQWPRDAQLRYYYQKGFREIVAVLPNYFPHQQSLDYGVLLRGKVPLSRWCFLWKVMPFGMLRWVLGRIAGMGKRDARPVVRGGAGA